MSDPTRHRLAPLLALLALSACGTVERVRDAGPAPGPRFHPYVRRSVLGRSVQGRPIASVEVGRGREVVLVMAAFHGDEWQSAYVAHRLADYLIAMGTVPAYRTALIVPEVNPDGLAIRSRANADRVDLNRNFPAHNWRRSTANGPQPASEPETRLVMDLVERCRPFAIVSIHTMRRGRHCVNYDGPAELLARTMARRCGYPVRADIGYATPGSFGTYAGKERGIPTITLELPRAETALECWLDCEQALLAAISYVGPPGRGEAEAAAPPPPRQPGAAPRASGRRGQ